MLAKKEKEDNIDISLAWHYTDALYEMMGFEHVASGPMVRSSYHADLQAQGQHVS